MRNLKKHQGFTLVELIMSLALTSIIMLGMSVFFTSSFRNLFEAQENAQNTQNQFVLNEIIREKFTSIKRVIEPDLPVTGASEIVIQNDNPKASLPFTYIGNANDKLAFKDFIIYNKIVNPGSGSHVVGNSGNGSIDDIVGTGKTNLVLGGNPLVNFAGFDLYNGDYYVAHPINNRVYVCKPNCTPVDIEGLDTPVDIAINGDMMYVSNAGAGEILAIDIDADTQIKINTTFDYPTGLAYYNEAGTDYLFVSDTAANQVYKVNIATGAKTTVAGDGDIKDCHLKTGKYCQLNKPVGLYVGTTSELALYIADAGNNRILKISDPEDTLDKNITFFTDNVFEAINSIEITFPGGTENITPGVNAGLPAGGTHTGPAINPYKYTMSGSLEESTEITNACTGDGCTASKNKIKVNVAEAPLFTNGAAIKIDNEPSSFTITNVNGNILTISPDFAAHKDVPPPAGVHLIDEFNPNTEIDIDFNNLDISSVSAGYSSIIIKGYDVDGTELFTRYDVLRSGDDILGSDEDMAEVVISDGTHDDILSLASMDFPTGVSDAYFSDSINDITRRLDNSASKAIKSFSVGDFSNFDFTSGFTLDDLNFNSYNGKQVNDILQMNMTITPELGTPINTTMNAHIQ